QLLLPAVRNEDKPVLGDYYLFKKESRFMSQQQARFEEEFPEESRASSYQAGYRNSPSAPFPSQMQPFQSDESMPGQKLLDYEPQANKSDTLGVRLALMVVSISLIFVLFIIAM